MSHVEFKKCPCRLGGFKGLGPYHKGTGRTWGCVHRVISLDQYVLHHGRGVLVPGVIMPRSHPSLKASSRVTQDWAGG